MRFRYGKNDWKTFERGEENCYLMSNGLGGFSSLSLIGSCNRNDQAVLMACVHSPNNRYNMIHRLEEHILVGEQCYTLSSQDFQIHEKREKGYLYQSGFVFEDYPVWTYLINGVEVVKTIVLQQGKNAIGISYEIRNRSEKKASLFVRPHLQFVPKGERLSGEQEFVFEMLKNNVKMPCENDRHNESGINENGFVQEAGNEKEKESVKWYRIASNGQTLYGKTNGDCHEIEKTFCDTLYYSADVEDGKMPLGRSAVNHEISFAVEAGGYNSLEVVYGMSGTSREESLFTSEKLSTEEQKSGNDSVLVDEILPSVKEMKEQVGSYRRKLKERAAFTEEIPSQLAVSAEQYISDRVSTGKKTILAGFPFFEDWGRDTMISLPGCCLAVRQFDTAKSIFETFMKYCKNGLMPNLFPEGTQKPWYNTVDAALLFILSVYEYEQITQDSEFVKKAYPVMKEIIAWYQKGTDFNIHMDEDGLIVAGSGYDQVTWMDVRVENILPTPRHGKPVEINAYWYNALCMMDEWQKKFEVDDHVDKDSDLVKQEDEAKDVVQGEFQNQNKGTKDYASLAKKVKQSFEEKFWNEEAKCLKDVISDTKADAQIRCNQIWAVSQPFSVLPEEKEKQVVETVFRHLYTPYGLRTLSPEDGEFRPFYGGAQLDRDLAYHQGTVWTFPMGAYYLAYLKVNAYSEEAKEYVKEQLNLLEPALREGCIGQLPEIYDGENPVSSKGCFAQAWSVGEILRVYDALRR